MQSSRTSDCILRFRKLGLPKAATRCLSLTSLHCGNSKDTLIPGNLNTYFRIFGFKTESTKVSFGNILYSHRRRLRRAMATFLFTPLYILPFITSEISFFGLGGIDTVSLAIFTLVSQLYAASIIHAEKGNYPYVHQVLFNPYDGGVILKREQWRSVINPRNIRRPTLELFYIEPNSDKYVPIGTTIPEGFAIQEADTQVIDGDDVKHHEGFVHSDVILNDIAFDNYMTELLESKMMNEMISIRFQKDRVYRLPDATYGKHEWAVETTTETDRMIHAKQRRHDWQERHKHPTFFDKTDV